MTRTRAEVPPEDAPSAAVKAVPGGTDQRAEPAAADQESNQVPLDLPLEEDTDFQPVRLVLLALWLGFGLLGVHCLYAGALRAFFLHWALLAGAAGGWMLAQAETREVAFAGWLICGVALLAVAGRLLFDLARILLGVFRDRDGDCIRRWY